MKRQECCKGCKIFTRCPSNIDEIYSCLDMIKDYINCPCSKCILKVICETPCNEFIEFKSHNFKNKNKKMRQNFD